MQGLKYVFAALLAITTHTAYGDHRIEELQGKWYSTLWPTGQEFYQFSGLKELGSKYVFEQTRNLTEGGVCIGSGVIDLHAGTVRSVETCPRRDGQPGDAVYFSNWTLVVDHDRYHLRGGYYSLGSASFMAEDLDKLLDHDDDDGHDDGHDN